MIADVFWLYPITFYFSKLFFTFTDYKWSLQALVFALFGGISECLLFLETLGIFQKDQLLHFSSMFLVLKPGSQAHSSQGGRNFLCQNILAGILFCSVILPFLARLHLRLLTLLLSRNNLRCCLNYRQNTWFYGLYPSLKCLAPPHERQPLFLLKF